MLFHIHPQNFIVETNWVLQRKYLNFKKESYRTTEEAYFNKPFFDERDELLRLLFELRSDCIKQFERKIEECEGKSTNKSKHEKPCAMGNY